MLLLTSKRNKIQFTKYSTLMLEIDIEFFKRSIFKQIFEQFFNNLLSDEFLNFLMKKS
jgi:hypothetical protein